MARIKEEIIYLTTPIYYVNSYPHLGHSYTTIVVDALARFYRLRNYEVFFLTGTDEHGDKILKASAEHDKKPQEFVDEVALAFKNTWDFLGLSYTYFIRTTSAEHKKTVQYVLQTLYEKGEFFLDEYEGVYCFGCERFLTSKELDENGLCRDHKRPPLYLKEKNYFFNLEKYRSWLKDLLYHEDLIYPRFYREEVLNMLEEPLPPLCISRPKSRLSWGIELPFDQNYVTYVWFDALLNYLSGIGYPYHPQWQIYWDKVHHFIAKDILRPHAIYWPIMLKAMELPPYKKLFVHGYWLLHKHKMSKSLGNIIDPLEISKKYGRDTLRYFLLREMAFGYDAEFDLKQLVNRHNADLANDYGNLIFRTLNLVEKFFHGEVPSYGPLLPEDRAFRDVVERALNAYFKLFEDLQFHLALEELWQAIRYANVYIDKCAPWKAIKEGNKARAGTILRNLLSAIKSFALALSPVLPESSYQVLKNLSLEPQTLDFSACYNWELPKEKKTITKGQPLFPRIESHFEEEKRTEEEKREVLSVEEFRKWDLRIGKILSAEKIEGTDKLLKLEVACPEKRQIVSGIALHYKPEELIGREVVLVLNLKPIKIKGVLSEGMLLTAQDEKGLTLVVPEREVSPGAKVS
ncbi:MAG: methionine--tRNA ligase [Caldimicrobium sp.]|nr:methionine--tRNA ligase [Caldimicrobium sp.]MCX7873450.1 methionine--tRNA ligase [Caldimicrobium sp.]MDW8095039.1 methionine--tRNA ligase [Caldimicrobium sp.]